MSPYSRKAKDERLQLRISSVLKQSLQNYAVRMGFSVSVIVEHLIIQALVEEERVKREQELIDVEQV